MGAAVDRSPPPALQSTSVPAAPLLVACATSPEEETTIPGQVIAKLISEGREEHCGRDASAGY